MNILSTQYTLSTKSFEIYLAGCRGNPKCSGCYTTEGWNFSSGKKYDSIYFTIIKKKISIFDNLVDNIMILGGEPLDQDPIDLVMFLFDIRTLNKTMWLFTRYDLQDIPKGILLYFDYVKCGRYIKELSTETNMQHGIRLATLNQKIYRKEIDF